MSKLFVDYTNHAGKRAWREIVVQGIPHLALYPPIHANYDGPRDHTLCIDVEMADRDNARRTLAFKSIHGFHYGTTIPGVDRDTPQLGNVKLQMPDLFFAIEPLAPEIVSTLTAMTQLANYFHNRNKRWWYDRDHNRIDRNKGELIALIHSELSELLEAERRRTPKMSEKLALGMYQNWKITEAEEEIADAVIRIFDYCGAFDLRLGVTMLAKAEYNAKRADHTHEHRDGDDGKVF